MNILLKSLQCFNPLIHIQTFGFAEFFIMPNGSLIHLDLFNQSQTNQILLILVEPCGTVSGWIRMSSFRITPY